MARPRILCIDVMGSTFNARLLLDADQEQTQYTMTCTGTVYGGPAEMTIQDDPCGAMKGQQWTCQVDYDGGDYINYLLVGGGHGGMDEIPIMDAQVENGSEGPSYSGTLRLGACGIQDPVECPEEV
jgi:hypothetical protein